MYYFIPHSVIFLAGVGLLYILSKKVEVILQLPAKPENIIPQERLWKKAYLQLKDWFLALKHRSFGPAVLGWLEKRLRQLRIVFLKSDNFLQWIMEKAKEKSQTWSVRSRAWKEQKRTEKLEKLKVMEKLNKVEFLEMIQENGHDQQAKERPVLATTTRRAAGKRQEILQQEKEHINRIAKNPKDSKAYLALGKLYLQQKNITDAQASFTQVLKIEPDNQEAKTLLGQLEEKRPKIS
ncbi:MAG: hypothetical protein COU85_02820 [Candidatus Portnoybacteria bacterium CG10_big_fil_rev_8_21_14_0_10_44_7]|uniref:Uncharacterized protein n=1 Tax=Candidatus Portnoybacteria bacterium CG10_big_fil_rev_8_21_14_0_10_44_7 TaxID=1974816 RepID=A0A2M8KI80_9BACT|nr:MAG: hypothetical protein COU85_02820 [Candidatus Portnoybacteria bacterium CG10_big_fil_rev_8_21_14_0_10_44_7]